MTNPSEQLQAWQQRAQYLTVDGHRIAWWQAGKSPSRDQGDARPLLLIHGFPTASWDWHAIWQPLSAGRLVIACDMLGFGFSDKPRQRYRLMQQADIQLALLDHLGVGEWDMLVHDYGVSVGQELLARQLEGSGAAGLGKSLFLNGGLFPDQHRALTTQKLAISPVGFLVSWMMNRDRLEKSFRTIFGDATPPSAQEMDEFWALITHNDGNRIIHRLMQYINDRRSYAARWADALRRAKGPLKLINGSADPISGKHLYEAWQERVPQGEAVLLPDIGHYPQVEAPEAVLRETLAFLDG